MISAELKSVLEKTSYFTASRYISGRIIEYDIKSANINMLYRYNIIDKDRYNYLYNLPKMDREIDIGLMIRGNKDIDRIIRDGIKEYKIKFAEANNIQLDNIIRIANDALYINSPIDLKYRVFDNIEFKQKSVSNIVLKLKNIIFFCKFLPNNEMDIDIKGLGSNSIIHQNYMIYEIGNIIYLFERVGIEDSLNYLSELIEKYIKRELNIEMYREFSSVSKFLILSKNNSWYVDNPPLDKFNDIDINYNLTILRELWSILISKYNTRR